METLEFTKKTGAVKQTVYENAELQSNGIRLQGDLTIDKNGSVSSYTGLVYATANGQIGNFRYSKGGLVSMAMQGGIAVDFNSVEYTENYAEASELLTKGIAAFESMSIIPVNK